jgi:hypothetical protein
MAATCTSVRSAPEKPFISVNCAAIPENLLEANCSATRRAPSPAPVARRIGKFEEADGGTLLLDEISEMDIRLQAKLLRAIQEREIDRVGGTKPVKVDIRIIATSNRDLQEAVARHVPRRPALPPQRREPADPAAARAARRHHRAGRPLRREIRRPPTALTATLSEQRVIASARPPGSATCANSRTPCTAPCCWRAARRSIVDDHPPADGRPCAARRAGRTANAPSTPPSRHQGRASSRPDRGRSGAGPDPRHARPLPGQPHARRQHPRHLDPHAAQQASRIFRTLASKWPHPAKSGLRGKVDGASGLSFCRRRRVRLERAGQTVCPGRIRPGSWRHGHRHHGDWLLLDCCWRSRSRFRPDPDDGAVLIQKPLEFSPSRPCC